MLLSDMNFNRQYTNRLWLGARYLAIVIFVVQLIGMGFHKHEITEESSECASCILAAQLPSGTPSVTIDAAPTLTILFYPLVSIPLYFFLARQSYLVPLSHAPPRRANTQ